MEETIVEECINLAITLKEEGRRVVGIDLCGDPRAGELQRFVKHFQNAKKSGLGVTVHIAKTADNPASETDDLLHTFAPSRLGHATFLDEEAMKIVFKKDIAAELCLTGNLLHFHFILRMAVELERKYIMTPQDKRNIRRILLALAIATSDDEPYNPVEWEFMGRTFTPPTSMEYAHESRADPAAYGRRLTDRVFVPPSAIRTVI
ncbi:hypothetical protein GLOTRDRAFT_129445 [Gloeophyllum trabeum ATCC 11539]|uniref:Adenosine deaminase domain-containing protein n=1 Tax=Gloeophyllum trabeum (strain ATCC 11539 / FP-39264 / Madison 617) TaxID=670483 RepID=S7Q6U8_GLOTA|nr:uncharacterized protein GLOTRDRAFT_129445 [Gloeophyllum trabeum ATCC 11539]EPQ55153.1 hypothetical protein GLOTRDRAFT_129445 [Gloeophyllum trabeum ATCC 11539]